MSKNKRFTKSEEVETTSESTRSSRNTKSKPNGRGKRPSSTRQGAERSKHNDASWYERSLQLVQDAANLSYASLAGARLEKDSNFNDNETVRAIPSIPGVMAFRWSPSVGLSIDGESAINVASKRLYSFIRHANSGSSNYDSPDLMLYILAMDSLYALHAMGVRAYGIAQYYLLRNRYVPDTLLNACG